MKRLTSFTKLTTGEGTRISFTYSELDEGGNLISQNKRENFVVVDDDLQLHVDAIERYITDNKLV